MSRVLSVFTLVLVSLQTFSLYAQDMPAEKTYINVAHRGGASIGNENTLSCIAAGIAAGADMVEIDIHLTKDGQMVVCHDPTIDRTTDGQGAIEEMTADEIRAFHIVDSRTGELTDETVPTLEEVLDLVSGECSLLVEVKRKKNQYPGIEEKLVEAIDAFGARRWVTVQSFNDRVIEKVHAIAPDIPVHKLIVCRLPFGLAFDGRIVKFNYDKYDYVESVNVHRSFATKAMVRKAHAAGKKVGVWTVDKPRQVERIRDRVDMIITNSPDLF